MQQTDEIENKVNLGPRINAVLVLGGVFLLDSTQKVAICGNNRGGNEEDKFTNKAENPDGQMNNIGTLAPVKQREEYIKVEEGRTQDVNL